MSHLKIQHITETKIYRKSLYEKRTDVNVSVQYVCDKCIIFLTTLFTALSATNITQSLRKVNEFGMEHLSNNTERAEMKRSGETSVPLPP
jgi:hypothetical protein